MVIIDSSCERIQPSKCIIMFCRYVACAAWRVKMLIRNHQLKWLKIYSPSNTHLFFLVVLPHIPERSGDLKTSYLNGALKIFDLIFAQSLPHDPYEQRIALINLGQNPVCNMIEHQALHIYESDFWWFLFEWLYQTFIQCLNVNLLVNLVQVINIIYNFI